MNKVIEFIHNGDTCIKQILESYDWSKSNTRYNILRDFENFLDGFQKVMIKDLIHFSKEFEMDDKQYFAENHCPDCGIPLLCVYDKEK